MSTGIKTPEEALKTNFLVVLPYIGWLWMHLSLGKQNRKIIVSLYSNPSAHVTSLSMSLHAECLIHIVCAKLCFSAKGYI